jgi:exodeoxyribonuclease VII small subunit
MANSESPPAAAAATASTEVRDAQNAPANLGFEALVGRLESIVAQLEGDSVSLETALALFEEGMGLSKRGTQQLDLAERRLELLLEDGRSTPLDLDL